MDQPAHAGSLTRRSALPAAAFGLLAPRTLVAQTAPAPPVRNVVDTLPELDRVAQQAMQRTGVPGMAIAVVYRDQAIYLKGFGVRRVGSPDQVDADTVFALASLSKPIASITKGRTAVFVPTTPIPISG